LVWLVALGSAGVANAEIPPIRIDEFDAFHAQTAAECALMATALNSLEGVSNFDCNVYLPHTHFATYNMPACIANAFALNKLVPYYITCHWGHGSINDYLHGSRAGANAIVRLLQGPTCKHGNPIPGPSGGGNCTGNCDQGWKGRNCDVSTGPPPPPPPPPPPHPLPPPGKCGVATGNFIDSCFGCEQLGPPDCIFRCKCGPQSALPFSVEACYRLTERNLCQGNKNFELNGNSSTQYALLCADNTTAPEGAQDCAV